jgi:hypothetical protein
MEQVIHLVLVPVGTTYISVTEPHQMAGMGTVFEIRTDPNMRMRSLTQDFLHYENIQPSATRIPSPIWVASNMKLKPQKLCPLVTTI